VIRPVLALLLLPAAMTAAHADACRRKAEDKAGRFSTDCPQDERLQPYDPSRVGSGSAPGFIELGNGTEVRVGGRVRMDYDVRR
jgi:hypothetical protein